MRRPRRAVPVLATLGTVAVAGLAAVTAGADPGSGPDPGHGPGAEAAATTTPIKHLVVIFGENVSFDHYFGTYPYAANLPGEPAFSAAPGTPSVNGLVNAIGPSGPTGPLLTGNPNGSAPTRLGPNDPMTCDQDHGYAAEQAAADHGAEDQYPANTGRNATVAGCLGGFTVNGSAEPVPAGSGGNAAALAYYDGNTVTALWNYAQHFAMSDNSYGTTYGPSTPGALNVTSAQTYGALCGPTGPGRATINDQPCGAPPGLDTGAVLSSAITTTVPTPSDPQGTTAPQAQPAPGPGTDVSDADPTYDICSYAPSANGGDGGQPAGTITMGGPTVGDELDQAGLTWGWFQGGFDDGYVPGHGTAPTTAQVCSESHKNVGGNTVTDYIPHHDPFEYYASTANPMHLPPTSVAAIGHTDQANHNYDLADFWAAADGGNLPAVSFLKAPAYEDGHAGYSDPTDEQRFLVDTINHLETLPSWRSTAVVINWDDSDGWYDHVLAPLTTGSQTSLDSLTGPGACGSSALVPTSTATGQPEEGKCGLGPRIPFMVVSPYSRPNYVDNTLTDQSSVVRFIEDNWRLPALGDGAADVTAGSILSMFDFGHGPGTQPPLFLSDTTGEPTHGPVGPPFGGPQGGPFRGR